MNIDDILKKNEFKNLDEFLDKEMVDSAGKELYDQIIGCFGDQSKARNWFYSNIWALGGVRPYDYCKQGKTEEIAREIGAIEYGLLG